MTTAPGRLAFVVDGVAVEVEDDGASLLEVLRDRLGRRSPKDGCSPQGQCGCCTVWVDGRPRVSCVTAARRVAGRAVTTLDGLEPGRRDRWLQAFTDAGASQCGFCTPGIVMRLAALEDRVTPADESAVTGALAAHLCRCTGWRTVVDAAATVLGGAPEGPTRPTSLPSPSHPAGPRRPGDASERARLEGGHPQIVGPAAAAGEGGFAEDTAPADALVAVPDGHGGWSLGPSMQEARRRARRVPGRNSTVAVRPPLDPPPGEWALVLQTSFVEPAYLEPDASWCHPGATPADPLANGGAFGGKVRSDVGAAARRLADEHGRAVRVVYSREDVVRLGPKRPPIAAGVRADGTGVVRVARTPGSEALDRWAAALRDAAPGLEVEEVSVAGPPVSDDLRGAGWAEGAVLSTAVGALTAGRIGPGHPVTVTSPQGATATATVDPSGAVAVSVAAGAVLDEIVLRSYCVGAVHQALGWVRREGLAVDEEGRVLDLTIRSFGILPARAMPPVSVSVDRDAGGEAVAAGVVVMAAVAAATWLAEGLPPVWPTERGKTS